MREIVPGQRLGGREAEPTRSDGDAALPLAHQHEAILDRIDQAFGVGPGQSGEETGGLSRQRLANMRR